VQLVVDVEGRPGVTGLAVVTARGEIDLGSAPRLRDVAVDRLMAGEHTLVMDLSEVEFLDSTGLGTLVAILKRARSLGGDVALVITSGRIRKPFELTGLTAAFAIHGDVDSAVAAVLGQPA
jgi:anti-sigma B factor antagonist